MTDSGSPRIPQGPKPVPPPPAARVDNPEAVTGRVINVPSDIREARQIVKIRGEIIKVERDQKTQEIIVQVRTARGDVEVRLKVIEPGD